MTVTTACKAQWLSMALQPTLKSQRELFLPLFTYKPMLFQFLGQLNIFFGEHFLVLDGQIVILRMVTLGAVMYRVSLISVSNFFSK